MKFFEWGFGPSKIELRREVTMWMLRANRHSESLRDAEAECERLRAENESLVARLDRCQDKLTHALKELADLAERGGAS